ncbi:MAG: bifunctional aldolase/short-chain dehydrogenase [Proteobacteria bacterium]|nr:bifunctional aldolase/short-chain dehydrogenase [Pseudomonadota bacterium]MDA1022970.1 bifunctional aldolase/short-chain dehydrogenase [Pseudomonadota bacterium]
MKNLWSDHQARSFVLRYAKAGVNRDRALRVYTSRLLGGEPRLVLHGGGNTSVKTTMPDIMGEKTEVLCVKGSGWDMGDIEPQGLPAVRLQPLRQMVALNKLSDEDMVNAQRINLLDSTSPNPSVETLLHAFLPHKFIDHTHSNAVLSLTDQKGGDALCKRVFGKRMGYVPYIMPGFDLSKKALEVYEADPSVEGLILFKHGIFTFGDTAKEAYGRMIEMVSLAERRLKKARKKVFAAAKLPKKIAGVADIAPILRGLTRHGGKRLIFDFRGGKNILNYVGGKDIRRYACQGTVTPDHVIRTKHKPLILPAPVAGDIDAFKKSSERALAKYVNDYHAYFRRNNARQKIKRTELDPMPRMIMVPGVGVFGLGANAKAAAIAADLAETNIEVITKAERINPYQVISEADIFDLEYWSLEQAKLGKGVEKPLARHVSVVTGGGSGIGAATARALAAEGSEVAVLDRDLKAAQAVAAEFGGLGLSCDVTDGRAVRRAFDAVAKTFGGVDIVVSNAGAAWQGAIGTVSDKILRDSFELNFFAHQSVAQNAVRIMTAQNTGGCLLFNTSKQSVNPGKDFGPYGLPKAATVALMRQYALDYGHLGIKSNAVNADRIRSGLLTDDMVKARSKARGLSRAEYLGGNLLGKEVTAEDVAKAFVDLARSTKTTASIVTVDGGNIAAALR